MVLTNNCLAENIIDSLQRIESEWTTIYYKMPKQSQELAYSQLLSKVKNISAEHPNHAELLIWEAIIKATNADHQNPIQH